MTSPYASVRYASLKGRSVLITGGASGLGAAMVEAYVEQEAKVTFLDVDVGAGALLAERTQARFIECDLLDIEALRAAVKEVERAQDGIGVLVNNAGKDDRQAPVIDRLARRGCRTLCE
jgi:NAD(P)-dependent dehydrogenase (short-subunit alcohol dehydrogenase family)